VRDGEYPFPFPEGQVWAEPDVARAAWLMRRLCGDPRSADQRVAPAAEYLRQYHSRATVDRLQAARIRLLATSLKGI